MIKQVKEVLGKKWGEYNKIAAKIKKFASEQGLAKQWGISRIKMLNIAVEVTGNTCMKKN